MSYRHLLGLPLRHKMADIEGLLAELQTLMKLDGSTPMTGALTTPYVIADYVVINRANPDAYLYRSSEGTLSVYQNLRVDDTVYWFSIEPFVTPAVFRTKDESGASVLFQARRTSPPMSVTCAILQGDTEPSWDIPRAGNIDFLDDKFLKIGKDSDGALPAASADYRGKVIRVEGGAGVADHFYGCRKLADESYEWTQIA